MKQTKIEADVVEVLRGAQVSPDGLMLTLPGQLERSLYVRVDKVLTGLGGAWNRKAKGHLFQSPVRDLVEDAVEAGAFEKLKDVYQWFPTPREVVERLVDALSIPVSGSYSLLEPSAGDGALLEALPRHLTVAAVEVDPKREAKLRSVLASFTAGHYLQRDFLECTPADPPTFDFVLMNPPFSEGRAVKHVNHAIRFLRPGGRLVAVVPSSVEFRTDRAHSELRDRVYRAGGSITKLPQGSFEASGTSVSTCMLTYTQE